MNENLIQYIKDIISLRGMFSTISHVEKKAEIMKVWARWIITHRSLCRQSNLILPDDDEYDSQLIVELQEKGANRAHAYYLHDWLIRECQRVNKNYTPIATMEYGGIQGNVTITLNLHGGIVSMSLENNEMPQTIPTSVYNRMSRNYNGLPLQKNSYIWLCCTVYDILDGKGLQWAVPPPVMELLQSHLGCYTELFASPLNAYNKHYYSLFPLDSVFGSKGNFFTAPDSDFHEGTYQINPPFIDQLFTKTSERVLELLDRADQEDRELTFIYVMPEWRDFVTYDMIADELTDDRFHEKDLAEESIRDYTMGSPLGSGKFGMVYIANKKSGPYTGKPLALKILFKSQIKNMPFHPLREYYLQSLVGSHPNVLDVYSIFSDRSKYYIALEYAGTDIKL